MDPSIHSYHHQLEENDRLICERLAEIIQKNLNNGEGKTWHGHPVWFIEGNPIAGYSKQKAGIRLMFWSGADFNDEDLNIRGDKFKDASIFYNALDKIDQKQIKKWLQKAEAIQYDYKNLVKRKGKLLKLKG